MRSSVCKACQDVCFGWLIYLSVNSNWHLIGLYYSLAISLSLSCLPFILSLLRLTFVPINLNLSLLSFIILELLENELIVNNFDNPKAGEYHHQTKNKKALEANWKGTSFCDKVPLWAFVVVECINRQEQARSHSKYKRKIDKWSRSSSQEGHIESCILRLVRMLQVLVRK